MSNPNQYPGHPAYGQPAMNYPGQYPPVAPGQYPSNPAAGYNQYPPAPYAYPPQAYAPNGYAYPNQAPPYGPVPGYQQPQQQPYPLPQQSFYPPQPLAPQMNPAPLVMSSRPAFQDWYPNAAELQQIDLWLQEADPERTGLARGATVVPLFTRSNLQNEVLKELWRLVDWKSQGSLDREQFTIAIRFLCILCNPIYAGSKPTVELFNQAISKDLSLPSQMLKREEPVLSVSITPQESLSGLPSPLNASSQPQYRSAYPASNINVPYPPVSPIVPNYQANAYQQHSPLPQHQQMASPQPQIVQAPIAIDEDEEFSDFAEASHEPITQQHPTTEESWDFVSASTTVLQEPVSANPSNISSLMDFDLLGSQSPTVEKGMITAQDHQSTAEEEEDEFGEADFQQATPPVPTKQLPALPSIVKVHQIETASESVQIQPETLQMPTLMSMNSMASASKLSAFDELVEQNLMTTAVEGEDWDDFADASAVEAVPSQPSFATAVISSSDNPFDDIEDVSVSIPVINAPVSFNSAPSFHTPALDAMIEETEDDFGDFESNHSPLPAAESSMTVFPIVDATVEIVKIQQDEKLAVVVEEEDFGDFEAHSNSSPLPTHHIPPIPVHVPVAATVQSFEPMKNEPMPPAMMEDLLDLLSDPVPMANHIVNNGGLGLSFSKRTSADFLDLLSSPEPVIPATAIKISPQPQHQEEGEDESFGDFSAAEFAPMSAPITFNHSIVSKSNQDNAAIENLSFDVDFDAEFEPFQSVSAPPPTANELIADVASLPSPIDQARPAAISHTIFKDAPTAPRRASNSEAKPLSMKELEGILVQLVNKDLYDEAYACSRQISFLKQMQDLIELKNTALEKDDMEAATKIKEQTTELLPLIESKDEEQLWKEAASNKKRQGLRLEVLHENLSLFNEALARKFKAKFMNANSVPVKNAPIESRMRFHALAKRSSRILLAISSSHSNHPAMWKQLIDHILPFVAEQQKIISAFQQLSAKERSFVKASSKFQGYLQSLVAVLEGGVWLFATCQEALMLENESNRLYISCQNLLMIVARDCGTSSQLLGKTIEEITLQAGKVSERSGVIYCNITFRPLFLTAAITGEKKELCSHIGKKQGVHYQLALMNLWLQNIASTFPRSDGEFA